MILIIEGPDLSGKTYAIDKISKHFNSGFILKNAFKPRSIDDSPKIYKHYRALSSIITEYDCIYNQLIILDRFFPSQAVYSILRGYDDMDNKEIAFLENICKIYKVLYIYLDTPLYLLKNRYKKHGDEYIKNTQLDMLKQRYDTFYETTKLTKLKVDTTQNNWLKKVESFINENGGIEKCGKN